MISKVKLTEAFRKPFLTAVMPEGELFLTDDELSAFDEQLAELNAAYALNSAAGGHAVRTLPVRRTKRLAGALAGPVLRRLRTMIQ